MAVPHTNDVTVYFVSPYIRTIVFHDMPVTMTLSRLRQVIHATQPTLNQQGHQIFRHRDLTLPDKGTLLTLYHIGLKKGLRLGENSCDDYKLDLVFAINLPWRDRIDPRPPRDVSSAEVHAIEARLLAMQNATQAEIAAYTAQEAPGCKPGNRYGMQSSVQDRRALSPAAEKRYVSGNSWDSRPKVPSRPSAYETRAMARVEQTKKATSSPPAAPLAKIEAAPVVDPERMKRLLRRGEQMAEKRKAIWDAENMPSAAPTQSPTNAEAEVESPLFSSVDLNSEDAIDWNEWIHASSDESVEDDWTSCKNSDDENDGEIANNFEDEDWDELRKTLELSPAPAPKAHAAVSDYEPASSTQAGFLRVVEKRTESPSPAQPKGLRRIRIPGAWADDN
ncbi:MAG: hypothetical protein M1814_006560 [Vezdaea aestivalis]|nr:MAG: hypothetical protein M1814_006560 [Vezdaea aestivalis]